MPVRAVLFDLDDTLYDYQHARRCGLGALREHYPALREISLEELERVHEEQLQANFLHTLEGRMSTEQARVERLRGLLAHYGVQADEEEGRRAVELYRAQYDINQRPVPGALALLQRLRGRVRLGMVTNGLPEIQEEKIALCKLGEFFDAVLVSGAFGANKPDGRIFAEALRRLGVGPAEAVFVGDSWTSDVEGASRCGMRALWLNRYGQVCPDPGRVREVGALEPVEEVAGWLLEG